MIQKLSLLVFIAFLQNATAKSTKPMQFYTRTSLSGLFFGLLFLFNLPHLTAQKTSVHGKVVDAQTREGLPYATVQLPEVNRGTRTDINGNFHLESDVPATRLRISYVGYTERSLSIKPGEHTELNIQLTDAAVHLKEIEVRPDKYKNKNPAVDLIREVFAHKDLNRKEGLEYYNYQAYEKLQLDLNNLSDKFRNRRALRKFQFIFENVDTNKVNGKVYLPVYLRERLLDVYYRKHPRSEKEYVLGEQQAGLDGYLDGAGVSTYLNNLYQNVDIYDANISLLSTQFVGPLSALAPAMYRFYIMDTVEVEGAPMADIFFAPRNKTDQAFMGNMLVSLDSTYAVRKVQMGISKDINLNWVSNLAIEQEFEFFGTGKDRRLMLVKDEISMDFQILKSEKRRSMLGHRSVSYRDYHLNAALPDSLFQNRTTTVIDEASTLRSADFWLANRHSPLSGSELGIYKMVDSVQTVPAFRRASNIAMLVLAGYKTFGFVDVGPVNTFYSFNDIEGFRLRAGGRTNPKLYKNLMLEWYGAYGFKDKKWKYYAGATYSFNGKPLMYPMNQLTVSYQNEIQIPGENLQFVQEDNFLLSFKRGVNNKMIYNRNFQFDYVRELRSGLRYTLSGHRLSQSPAGVLKFEYVDVVDGTVQSLDAIVSTELGVSFRYAPNEKFYQGKTYRKPIMNKYPVFQVDFKAGVPFLGGNYNYQQVTARISKVFYIAPLGYSDWSLEGGRLLGSVPYPLLEIHRANQTYSYQLQAYNLMNFMEFASDKYVGLNIQHNFNGFFFNKIPGLKRLKWREVASFKGLYGGLDEKNIPTESNGLLRFPVDEDGQTVIHTLEKKPYIEASVGIANILKLFRVDYVRRLTYTDLPGVSKWGVRARFKLDF